MIKPCHNCPFKDGDWLRAQRRQEIAQDLLEDRTFFCHATVNYENIDTKTDEEWWEEPDGVITDKSKECVGAMVISERTGFSSQSRRISQRIGVIMGETRRDLDGSEIPWETLDAWVTQGEEEEEGDTCSVVNYGCEAPAGFMGITGAVITGTTFVDTYCAVCGEPVCDSCSNSEGVCAYCKEGEEYE